GRGAGLAPEPGRRRRCGRPPSGPRFEMNQEPGQLDVGVAEAIYEADAMVGEDLACLLGRVVGDQEHRTLAERLGVVDELPGRGSVGLALHLGDDVSPLAAVPEEEVRSAVALPGLSDDLQPGDPAEHPEGLCLRVGTRVHSIILIHNDCEYSAYCEHGPGPD